MHRHRSLRADRRHLPSLVYPFQFSCQHIKGYDVYRKFAYFGHTRSFLAPLRLRAGSFRLALAGRRTGYRAATLCPELHTELLPAPHARVGNG